MDHSQNPKVHPSDIFFSNRTKRIRISRRGAIFGWRDIFLPTARPKKNSNMEISLRNGRKWIRVSCPEPEKSRCSRFASWPYQWKKKKQFGCKTLATKDKQKAKQNQMIKTVRGIRHRGHSTFSRIPQYQKPSESLRVWEHVESSQAQAHQFQQSLRHAAMHSEGG